MSKMTDEELITKMKKASSAVFLAAHEDVAKDISKILKAAIERIESMIEPKCETCVYDDRGFAFCKSRISNKDSCWEPKSGAPKPQEGAK